MFDFRSPLIFGAGPAGLIASAAGWLVFGQGGAASERLEKFEAALHQSRSPPPLAARMLDPSAQAMGSPMFALTTGSGAVKEPVLRLDGIARTPRGAAALLSVNGAIAAWFDVGETRDGVRLVDVQSRKVVLDTLVGLKEIELSNGGADATPGAPQAGAPPPLAGPPPADAPETSHGDAKPKR